MTRREFPLPDHFREDKVGEVWRVDYQAISKAAQEWRRKQEISRAHRDEVKTALFLVDVQNTFCIPGFELFVAGQSGNAAVEDNQRLCRFLYRNLGNVSRLFSTMDTHHPFQIFQTLFLVDEEGNHPEPLTEISAEEIREGRWKLAPGIEHATGFDLEYLERHLLHYAETLQEESKYDWVMWPFHAMLGGIGHALVSAVEEAIFFHAVSRLTSPSIHIKGSHPLTEHYSIFGPEVTTGPDGRDLVDRNEALIDLLTTFDHLIIAGQAKSHCVAWTLNDLLEDERVREGQLLSNIYLLEDCTSPVVVPEVCDFTEEANRAFERFADAGMHLVESTQPPAEWPGFRVGS